MISFSSSPSSSSSLFFILLVLLCTYYFSCPCLSTRNLKGNGGTEMSTTIWGSMVGVEHKGAGGGDIYNHGGGHDDDHVARMKLHEVNSGPNPISNSVPSCSQSKTAAPSSSTSNYSHQSIP